MLSLHELQRAFAGALLCGETADIEPYVVANGLEPAARLRIYGNNARENFLATLRATYPVLERLVGADYFRQLVLDYMQRFPSPSGDLHHAGERLASYLERRFGAGEYAYFIDVARLEWAYQEVLVAAEHAPLDRARLQSIDAAEYPELRFELHPAVRLIESAYPVLTIWSANQPGAAAEEIIDLRQGGERVLVRRTAEAVELARLSQADCAFLAAIARGDTLGEAAAAAVGAGEFDLGRALRRYVSSGVIADFRNGFSLENDS